MQRIVGYLVSFLGAFLIVGGLMGQLYAPAQLKKTPLDVTSLNELEGRAELGDGTGGTETFPVRAYSTTTSDSESSTDDVVLFHNSSCLVRDVGDIDGCVSGDDPKERLVNASTDTFATDRVTGLAVNDADILPASAEDKEGLVNKWPFDAQKRTYLYWDSVAGTAVDAVYDREEEVDGVRAYVYRVSVDDAPIELSSGRPGTYSDEKEIWVEPVTGAIIDQVDRQERLSEDGAVFLAAELAFTDQSVSDSAEEARSNRDSLVLVSETIPVVGYAAGGPLLLIGLALLWLSLRKPRESGSESAA